MPRTAVAYLRVSTDEERQDPERQLQAIEEWCDRERVELVDSVSEAASSKEQPNPLERNGFQRAVEAAHSHEADAIIVEQRDRFSRDEARLVVHYSVLLEERHGLNLWVASRPLEAQDKLVGSILDTAESAMAHRENEERARRVSEGMQRAKEEGDPIGRPPALSAEEARWARKHHDPDNGLGYRTLARLISKARGAFRTSKPKVRDEREVHYKTVQAAIRGQGPYSDLDVVRMRRQEGVPSAPRDALESVITDNESAARSF